MCIFRGSEYILFDDDLDIIGVFSSIKKLKKAAKKFIKERMGTRLHRIEFKLPNIKYYSMYNGVPYPYSLHIEKHVINEREK